MAENEQLRERIAILEGLLFDVRDLPIEWGLSNKEARVFGVLVNRPVATRECIYHALYGTEEDGGPPESGIETHVCKLRRKLKPFGISFKTRRFEGYVLPDAIRARFRVYSYLPRARAAVDTAGRHLDAAELLAGAA